MSYNPNQPRVPAGQPDGGQWASDAAANLNTHLAKGGVVQMTTYGKSTLYQQKHSGWFSAKKGNLHVQHGRGTNQLSIGNRLLVGLRMGEYKKK